MLHNDLWRVPAFSEHHRVSVEFSDEVYHILERLSEEKFTTMTFLLHEAVLLLEDEYRKEDLLR